MSRPVDTAGARLALAAAVAACVAAASLVRLHRRRLAVEKKRRDESSRKKRWGLLKTASNAIAATRRSDRFEADVVSPTRTDTPLQHAITALKRMGSALEAEGKVEEASSVLHVIAMLHASCVQQRDMGKRIFDELLRDATPEQAQGMRQWVEPLADDQSTATTANAAATQNSALNSRLMKWTRKVPGLVLGNDGVQLAQMLEHGVLEWEFDVWEVQRLSGGHALVALGWALLERHVRLT